MRGVRLEVRGIVRGSWVSHSLQTASQVHALEKSAEKTYTRDYCEVQGLLRSSEPPVAATVGPILVNG